MERKFELLKEKVSNVRESKEEILNRLHEFNRNLNVSLNGYPYLDILAEEFKTYINESIIELHYDVTTTNVKLLVRGYFVPEYVSELGDFNPSFVDDLESVSHRLEEVLDEIIKFIE